MWAYRGLMSAGLAQSVCRAAAVRSVRGVFSGQGLVRSWNPSPHPFRPALFHTRATLRARPALLGRTRPSLRPGSKLFRRRAPWLARTAPRPWFSTASAEGAAEVASVTEAAGSLRSVSWWLFGCAGMVFGMVALGGVTRLTGSGLSMVEWKPAGILPPLTRAGWQDEFDKYKQFPEYQRHDDSLTLEHFRWIWLMEWGHRMAGRATGIVFAAPLLYFSARGIVQRVPGLLPKLMGLLALGGSQGLIGWWMVRSGLDNKERFGGEGRVSPYRLATHLSMAFLLYTALFNIALPLRYGAAAAMRPEVARKAAQMLDKVPAGFKRAALGLSILVGTTAFSGAFVAGNRAGLVYDTFPKMGGEWVPSDIIDPYMEPKWRNVFENSTMVQWNHRVLAMSTLAGTCALWVASRGIALPPAARLASNSLIGMAGVQVSLGISTLLLHVPTSLASAHQMGSLALLTISMWLVQTLRPHTAARLIASPAARARLVRAAEESIKPTAAKI